MVVTALSLAAQTAAGTLRGQVIDPSGAVVTQATVVATGANGAAVTSITNARGNYEFKTLPAGQYTVTVSVKGFAPFKAEYVNVAAGQVQTLDAQLEILVEQAQVNVQDETQQVNTSADNNASTIVIKGKDLESLSDDPDELQSELEALAGPSAGPNGGQIYIDGFTNGTLPPKASIREIRINQNPFSAQFDHVGYGRIEILTKPGTDKFHGQFNTNINDAVLNSKNPYGPKSEPGYSTHQFSGNFGGPLSKRASFFFNAERRNINEASVISLLTDPNPAALPVTSAVLAPMVRTAITPRFDLQVTKTNTLTVRYQYVDNSQKNQGVGGTSAVSQAFNSSSTNQEVQISDSQTFGTRLVNELRYELEHSSNGSHSLNTTIAPTVSVLSSFVDGGASHGISSSTSSYHEIQNNVFYGIPNHNLKFGGRVRVESMSNSSTSNYNGTFTFSSVAAYLAKTPQQFTLTAGTPLASVSQTDVGVFAEDDWKVRPNFTLSYGLRVESQTNIPDHFDWAPRVGLAWGLARSKNTPKTVLRAGFGVFYDRFSDNSVLQTIRLNGILQQQYTVPNPTFCCDTASIPALNVLAANVITPSVYRIAPNLQAPRIQQAAFGLEQQVTKSISATATYINSRGTHQLYTVNTNAPCTADAVALCTTVGVRPIPTAGNVYQYTSEGIFKQNQLMTQVNVRGNRWVTFTAFYTLGFANGTSSSPVDQFNMVNEYGRTSFDVRHRATMFFTVNAPYGLRLSPMITMQSGNPYNFTIGRDLNGDSFFNDRPGLVTDSSRPVCAPGALVGNCVVASPFGLLDPNPTANERIIPVNFGTSPGQVNFNLRIAKVFGFGSPSESNRSGNRGGGGFGGPGGGGDHGHGPGGPGGGMRGGFGGGMMGGMGGGATSKRYNITLSAFAMNLFNHVNESSPIANLTSQHFGWFQSISGFGRFGGFGRIPANNRRIDLQLAFSF